MTLIIRRLRTEIVTFNNFVNTLEAGPKPEDRHWNSYKSTSQRHRTNFRESLCRGTLKYASGLFCTCDPLFATHTSDSANFPSWRLCREWTDADASNLSLSGFLNLFYWSETNCSKIPLLSDKLLKWRPFPPLPSLPDLLVLLFLF